MAYLHQRSYLLLRSVDHCPSAFGGFSRHNPGRGETKKLRERWLLKAQGENSESVSRNLTEEEARSVLGVTKTTSFEEIVAIKNRLLGDPTFTREAIQEIQNAYDLLLMKSMTKRVESSEEVPTSVRYADVQKRNLKKEALKIVEKIPTGGLAAEVPTNEALRANSIIIGVLALSILPQGFTELSKTYDTIPGIQIALACVWSVYALRQYKLLGFGRAVGYTLGGLTLGALIGSGIESVIDIHQHPLGGFHSSAVFVSEFTLLGVWASAVFLI